VSAKLTQEICINKASSNSRLTAVGRQATATDSHSQSCLQALFFSFLSPYLWWDNNWTTPASRKTYWNCIAFELGTLCWVLFVLCDFVLFCFSPLMRQINIWGTISWIGGWGMNTKWLRLKFYCIWTWKYLYIFFFHNFYFDFYFFTFYFQPSLCLSNAFSAYGWLVHCLYLFISLKLFLFVSLFCFFYLFICFPFPLTSLLSISSHPSIRNITSAIIIRQKILNCTQHRDNTNTKGSDGKTEKTGKSVSLQQKIRTGTRGKWRK
jgi:hypothetical protein